MPEQTTRDRILQVAQDLFTTKGFANASVREICDSANVSPPTIYYHFGDKDGLFETVVEETLSLDNFRDLLREEVAASPDPWIKLRAYIHTYLTRFPTHLLNPGLHLQNSTQLNGTSLRQLSSGIEAIHRLAKEILQTGIEAGQFQEVDVDTTAACLMGTVDSFVRAQVYLGVEYDPEEVTRCIADLFTCGLTAKRDEPV